MHNSDCCDTSFDNSYKNAKKSLHFYQYKNADLYKLPYLLVSQHHSIIFLPIRQLKSKCMVQRNIAQPCNETLHNHVTRGTDPYVILCKKLAKKIEKTAILLNNNGVCPLCDFICAILIRQWIHAVCRGRRTLQCLSWFFAE